MKMYLKESLLYRTGQKWKFWVHVNGGLFLILLATFVYWHGNVTLGSFSMRLLWIGITVFGFSTVFASISIKCPSCGAKWFWLAISKRHKGGWYKWLFSQKVCAICGADENGNKSSD